MIEITISGPGSVINYEYYIILKALKDAGVTVVEDNSDPPEDPQKFIDVVSDRLKSKFIKDKVVKLIAKHCPWGG